MCVYIHISHLFFFVFLVPFHSLTHPIAFEQNNDDAKVILANAVQHVGQSVKIWLAAADLEHDVKAKKRVLRKGSLSYLLSLLPF